MTTPRPGDFAVVTAGGLAGPVVGAAERWLLAAGPYSEYQHAFIYTGLDGDKAIIQAEPTGADWAPLTVHAKTLWSTGKFDLTHYQRGLIVGAAQRYIGTPYSFLDYLAIGLHRARIPIPHLQDFIKDTGHMICSALVDRCYQDAGIQLFDDHRWNGYVTPADLARRIS